MFSKKKSSKKIEISAPSNFQHRVHTGFDNHSNKFVGLPKQWASLVDDKPASQSPYRPAPMVDPMTITNTNDQENIYESRFHHHHNHQNYQNVHHHNNHTLPKSGILKRPPIPPPMESPYDQYQPVQVPRHLNNQLVQKQSYHHHQQPYQQQQQFPVHHQQRVPQQFQHQRLPPPSYHGPPSVPPTLPPPNMPPMMPRFEIDVPGYDPEVVRAINLSRAQALMSQQNHGHHHHNQPPQPPPQNMTR